MVKHVSRAQLNLQLDELSARLRQITFLLQQESDTHTFEGTFLQLILCKFKLKHLPPAGHLYPAVFCAFLLYFYTTF